MAVNSSHQPRYSICSSAIQIPGEPLEEIEAAFAMVCLPPSDEAHVCNTSIEGQQISAMG
jgi:hypothetical protein